MLRNILVPLDGSPLAELALPYATELARTGGAHLTLVRTARAHHRLHLIPHHDQPEEAEAYLHAQAEHLKSSGLTVDIAVPLGEPPDALLAEIERRQPDLIVMGTHGRSGLGRWVYGSITEAVIAGAGRPLMLVRSWSSSPDAGEPQLRGKAVLLPLDGLEYTETALPEAAQLARSLGGELVLLETVPVVTMPYSPTPGMELEQLNPDLWDPQIAENDARAHVERIASRLAASHPQLHVSSFSRVGEVTEVIRELAATRAQEGREIGMIVMATHARHGLGRAILGEDADAVLRRDDLPRVLVHPTAAEFSQDHVLAAAGARR